MRLTRQFFEKPTLAVARGLIGTELVLHHPARERRARIVETEAYLGPEDRASHASRGQTPRNAPMFGPAGFTYVYLIYGIHWCLNIVTESPGYPAAVLIRAVEPIQPADDARQASGPGKVCRWLGVDKNWNKIDATGRLLYIEKDAMPAGPIVAGTRIGVDYAGTWATKKWRFGLVNHPSLSRKF